MCNGFLPLLLLPTGHWPLHTHYSSMVIRSKKCHSMAAPQATKDCDNRLCGSLTPADGMTAPNALWRPSKVSLALDHAVFNTMIWKLAIQFRCGCPEESVCARAFLLSHSMGKTNINICIMACATRWTGRRRQQQQQRPHKYRTITVATTAFVKAVGNCAHTNARERFWTSVAADKKSYE